MLKISFLPGLRILFGLLVKYMYICKQSITKENYNHETKTFPPMRVTYWTIFM